MGAMSLMAKTPRITVAEALRACFAEMVRKVMALSAEEVAKLTPAQQAEIARVREFARAHNIT